MFVQIIHWKLCKISFCPYDHRKIVQVDFTDENRILYMVNDRTEVFIDQGVERDEYVMKGFKIECSSSL